jgi:succinoglycan biosynthesis transport protein ExoP
MHATSSYFKRSAPALEPNHRFGLACLSRHWKVVGLCAGAALVVGVVVAAYRPITYTASTQLLIYNRELQPGPERVISPGRVDAVLVENTVEIFKSRNVLSKVIQSLNLSQDVEFASSSPSQIVKDWLVGAPSASLDEDSGTQARALEHLEEKVAVERVGTSHIISLKVASSEPQKAALIANEIAQSASQIRTNTDSGSPTRATLVRERLQGLGPSALVISVADPPSHPDGPRQIVILLTALAAGLGLGTMLALFLDFRDRTIRTSTQVRKFLGLECLGSIPLLRRRNRRDKLPTHGPSASPSDFGPWPGEPPDPALCQALNRASVVIFSIHALRTIGVTSAMPADGATTVAAALAHLLARSGKRVLLVDGVRSNRSLSRATGTALAQLAERPSAELGLLGARFLSDTRTGVDILSIGEPAAICLDAAWWNRLHEILPEAANCYDRIIVDLPALASGPDVQIAAQMLDGLLLVLKWGGSHVEQIHRALDLLGSTRFKFVGAVLNMADKRLIGRYGDKLAAAEIALAAWRPAEPGPRSAGSVDVPHA